MTKVKVLAKLTMTRTDGRKTIVEVHEGASFHEFYKWFIQTGRKRKVYLRSSQRGDGITPYYRQAFDKPGLDRLAERSMNVFKNISDARIRILRKRAYEALLTCPADQLAGGLPKYRHGEVTYPTWESPIPVRIPVGYTTLQKRMDILTGAKR